MESYKSPLYPAWTRSAVGPSAIATAMAALLKLHYWNPSAHSRWKGPSLQMPLPRSGAPIWGWISGAELTTELATQNGEDILIAPWWPSQLWFPHLTQYLDQPRFLPYRRSLQTHPGQTLDGKSYHLHAWRL